MVDCEESGFPPPPPPPLGATITTVAVELLMALAFPLLLLRDIAMHPKHPKNPAVTNPATTVKATREE